METVWLVRCPDYDAIDTALEALLEMAGGLTAFVSPGERIVVKPNLLLAADPERAVTTHPTLITALGRRLRSAGVSPVLAESPGAGYAFNHKTLQRLYRTTGMERAARAARVDLSYDTSHSIVSFPEGEFIKRFEIITPVREADGLINLCKLKTHTFTAMTGAVKNLFGVIPGLTKPGYHAKLGDALRFSGMLLDLAAWVQPRLTLMDAVIGMEGDGPSSGSPRHAGWLLASRSPLALDVVAAEIMGLEPEHNPLTVEAARRGLEPHRLDQIEIGGADRGELRIPGWKLPATAADRTGLERLPWWQKALSPFFRGGLTVRPVIGKDCDACGVCRDACPVGAITIREGGTARIDDGTCIRCYCCHELCPNDAVSLRQSLLYRLVALRT